MSSDTTSFNYSLIPVGFYHHVTEGGNPIRRAWHLQKFERVLDCLPKGPGLSILDVGCFAGTFLSRLPRERFSRQVGVDILPSQVAFANEHFRTEYREFFAVPTLRTLLEMEEQFDCITVIEVIEHLTDQEIRHLFQSLAARLRPGGKLVVSTPNYFSAWPVLEFLLNRLSDVTYEEQHLNKFRYFDVEKRLAQLYPRLGEEFRLYFKTTTHFCSPFLAWISLDFAAGVSRLLPHDRWRFPLGSLILLQLERK